MLLRWLPSSGWFHGHKIAPPPEPRVHIPSQEKETEERKKETRKKEWPQCQEQDFPGVSSRLLFTRSHVDILRHKECGENKLTGTLGPPLKLGFCLQGRREKGFEEVTSVVRHRLVVLIMGIFVNSPPLLPPLPSLFSGELTSPLTFPVPVF